LLITNNYYAASVHCSYYGSFQFIKYALKKFVPYSSYKDLDKASGAHGKDSHENLYKLLMSTYRGTGKKNTEELALLKKISDLKTARKRADYQEYPITKTYSQQCGQKSRQIIAELKTSFGI
jgi:hypothetical protein